jgi:hypothetical protein
MSVSFKCPRCERISYNPWDAVHRYCSACKAFVDDVSNSKDSVYASLGDQDTGKDSADLS